MTDRRIRAGLAALVCALVAGCASLFPAGPSISPAPLVTAGPTASNEPAMTILPTDPPVDEPAPTATDDGTAGTPPCEVFDLKVSHGLVEATPEARSTELVLVAGITCSIDASPTLRMVDASGTSLATGEPGGSGALDLVPGVAYKSEVSVRSWCEDDPAFPVNLRLVVSTGEVDVTGDAFLDGDVPDCVDGVVLTIEATAWEPAA